MSSITSGDQKTKRVTFFMYDARVIQGTTCCRFRYSLSTNGYRQQTSVGIQPNDLLPLTTLILLGVTHFVFVLNERRIYGPILRLVKSLGSPVISVTTRYRRIPSALNAAKILNQRT